MTCEICNEVKLQINNFKNSDYFPMYLNDFSILTSRGFGLFLSLDSDFRYGHNRLLFHAFNVNMNSSPIVLSGLKNDFSLSKLISNFILFDITINAP